MIETKIVEKYKGLYYKTFESEIEMDEFIEENFEIQSMYIVNDDGEWEQI